MTEFVRCGNRYVNLALVREVTPTGRGIRITYSSGESFEPTNEEAAGLMDRVISLARFSADGAAFVARACDKAAAELAASIEAAS